MSSGKIVITYDGSGDLVPVLHDLIRARRPLPAATEAAEEPDWVLVEGYHDSGTINGVYGPYTEAHIDWLLAAPLQYHSGNWTKVKLSSGPEESSDGQDA